MAEPLKNHSMEVVQEAIAKALAELVGRPMHVHIASMQWRKSPMGDPSVDMQISAAPQTQWGDPFAGAI